MGGFEMENMCSVRIHKREISIVLAIPGEYAWDFMDEFGRTFEQVDKSSALKRLKAVDGYMNLPGGTWHIRITVGEEEEEKLHIFLGGFCEGRRRSPRETTPQMQR